LGASAIQEEKAALRRTLLQRLKMQSPAERDRRSQAMAEQVFALPAFQRARVIVGYSALPYEVDAGAIIDTALAQGKDVALPRVRQDTRTLETYAIHNRAQDLEPGPYGVLQPKKDRAKALALQTIEFVVVPGVGFDQQGRRLGHGQGYYDRWLQTVPPQVPRVGLAFACQVVERIPTTAHDATVTLVLSA